MSDFNFSFNFDFRVLLNGAEDGREFMFFSLIKGLMHISYKKKLIPKLDSVTENS